VSLAWFGQLLQSAMVATITDRYSDFGTVGRAALDMTAARLGVARAQLEHAGIIARFEAVLSADAVRRLKPAREPYRMAAERLGVEPGEVLLVAAHAWDVAGALRAGCSPEARRPRRSWRHRRPWCRCSATGRDRP
jgi:2-haloacid dehalogenase